MWVSGRNKRTLLRFKYAYLGENNDPGIVKEICGFNFTNLRDLYLCRNRIESIEVVSIFTMPKLRFLNLRNTLSDEEDNLVASIRPFRKANLPSLEQFYLSIHDRNAD